MGFDRNYDTLISYALNMLQYEDGYLDTDGEKAAVEARNLYAGERDRTADDILSEKPDLDLVYERIRGDLADIASEDADYAGVCEFVAEDLVTKLQEESGKSPIFRKIKRYGGMGILAALVVGYFGTWYYNDLTIDAAVETKEGLIQRAQAYEKLRTYNDWADTRSRRGGAIKGLILMPIEPDDEEFEAANEFANVTFEGLAMLTQEGAACGGENLLSLPEFNEAHLLVVDKVAESIQLESTQWEDPPIVTLLPSLVEQFPCGEGGGQGIASGEQS